MPNYPSSFDNGSAPGQRSVNNVTARRDFKYFLEPSLGSAAGFALSYATFVSLPFAPVYSNGVLTASTAGTIVVDESSFANASTSMTILVKNQGTTGGVGVSNGIYKVTTVGAAGVSYVLTRDTRFDEDSEFKRNMIFSIGSGTTNGNTKWFFDKDEPFIVGTDSPTFTAVPTTVTYNSAAKYPTDANVGIEEIGSWESRFSTNTVNDFKSMLNTMQSDLTALETSLASVTSDGNQWMASANTYTISHVYRRFEKLLFQLKQLRDDVDRMNTVGFSATYPGIGLTSRYPSGFNRLTTTAGGY